MKQSIYLGVSLLAVLILTSIAFALEGEIEKGRTLDSKLADWPKGLEAAITSQEHVGGYWVNANDCYWFNGDAAALNRFLAVSAKIDGAPVYVRLHTGKGEGKSLGDKASIPIDWQVTAFCRNWSDEWPKDSPTPFMVRIDVWDGGKVNRRAVVIPAGIIEQQEKATTAPATTQTEMPPQRFELKLKFNTPITPNYELKTSITLGEAFLKKADHEKGAFNVASGILLPAENGQYPLVLTTIDWANESDNMMGATKLMLQLGKPTSWEVSAGILHTYTVTLTRATP